MLRPHEDTFTALDHSGYRLMGLTFAAGRGFHETDTMLTVIPRELRNSFMLLPNMDERNTRDRSFLVHDLDTCTTEPFFYPLLPLCAGWFDRLAPGRVYDYFVPVCGCLFLLVLWMTGYRRGGAWGGLLALALFFGTPLPAWCFRGFYPEAVGAGLIGVAALLWAEASCYTGQPVVLGLLLGLALSFHPVFVAIALPLLALVVLTSTRPVHRVGAIAGFALGTVPLLVMTQWVCAPYGRITLDNLAMNFRASASHRIATLFALAGGLSLLAMVFLPCRRILDRGQRLPSAWKVSGGVVAGAWAVGPLVYALTRWAPHQQVYGGLCELGSALQWPFGLIVAGGAVAVIVGGCGRARALLWLTVFTAPIFLYLKGAEQMGLWSQRRLLPLVMLLMVTLLPTVARLPMEWLSRPGGWRRPVWMVAMALVALAGAANMARWPAPYWTRVEQGAQRWVSRIQSELKGQLTVFDYYRHSLPFAVDNRARVLGMNPSLLQLPAIMAWLGQCATTQAVTIATPYEPVALEEGLTMVPRAYHRIRLDDVRTKANLPADFSNHEIILTLLSAERVGPATPGLRQHKIMDGGLLGLRGPWGRRDINLETVEGARLPAMWTRQGSGVVGPVPPVGKAVELTLLAGSSRKGPQTLLLYLPWRGAESAGLPLIISEQGKQVRLRIPREDSSFARATGVYRFFADDPYDPAKAGVRGFDDDLGALVHSITMEVVD
ncbi:MAG: hypothetical protein NTV49_01360 [Kiritimatiellaeota bacterium]|nr:hypothetical protein [Kiritimatiellota bacterium]